MRRIWENEISDFSVGVRIENYACVSVEGGTVRAGSSGLVASDALRVAFSGVTVSVLPQDNPGVNVVPGISPTRAGAIELGGGGMTRGAQVINNTVEDVATAQNPFWNFEHGILSSGAFAPIVVGNAVGGARVNLVWLDGTQCAKVVDNSFGLPSVANAQPYVDGGGANSSWFDQPAAEENIVGGACTGGNYYELFAEPLCALHRLDVKPMRVGEKGPSLLVEVRG